MVGLGVKFFVLLNRLFGLAPFDMSLAVMAPKVVSHTSSITLKLHQMMPTYLALCFYVLCLASIFWQQRQGAALSVAANWLQFLPNAFSYVVALYMAIANRPISALILGTFYECDQKMQDHLGVSFRLCDKRANLLSYVFSAVAIVAGLGVAALSCAQSVQWSELWTILYWLAFCIPKFSLLLVNLQFASCVYYIISREVLLRKALNSCFASPGVILSYLPTDDYLSNKVSPVAGKRGPQIPQGAQLKSCSALLDVIFTIQSLVDRINAYFGKQLVMNLLSAFVCITVQLHYTIRLIRQAVKPDDAGLTVTFNSTLIAMHTIEILVIFACGDRAKVKWNELIAEVQRVRQGTTDEQVRVQLFDVINTMSYKRVEFHGCNLFSIDLSVITGVSGRRRS